MTEKEEWVHKPPKLVARRVAKKRKAKQKPSASRKKVASNNKRASKDNRDVQVELRL